MPYILSFNYDLIPLHSKFEVLEDGSAYMLEADISGKINASSGTIGGLVINENSVGLVSDDNNASISNISSGVRLSLEDGIASKTAQIGRIFIGNYDNLLNTTSSNEILPAPPSGTLMHWVDKLNTDSHGYEIYSFTKKDLQRSLVYPGTTDVPGRTEDTKSISWFDLVNMGQFAQGYLSRYTVNCGVTENTNADKSIIVETHLRSVTGIIATPYYEEGSVINAPTAVSKIDGSNVTLIVSTSA